MKKSNRLHGLIIVAGIVGLAGLAFAGGGMMGGGGYGHGMMGNGNGFGQGGMGNGYGSGYGMMHQGRGYEDRNGDYGYGNRYGEDSERMQRSRRPFDGANRGLRNDFRNNHEALPKEMDKAAPDRD